MNEVRPTRVYIDGCFDLVHFGHANAMRQALQMGDVLVVGVHSDAEIKRNKGSPVYSEEERYRLVQAIKWTGELFKDAPFEPTREMLAKVNCDFCVHGQDPSITADGRDTYENVKNAGLYRELKRTEGVSTTDLVDRILRRRKKTPALLPKRNGDGDGLRRTRSFETLDQTHFGTIALDLKNLNISNLVFWQNNNASEQPGKLPFTWSTCGMQYMANALRISQFNVTGSSSDSLREPNADDVVIYAPGVFDLFNLGHLCFLEKCLEMGTYILVGLYSDQTASCANDGWDPVLNLQERLLSVLACRYVSNVIIGAPYVIPDNLLRHFKVSKVVVGLDTRLSQIEGCDPMAVPKKAGIFHQVDSKCSVTTSQVITRILNHRSVYEERNRNKLVKEAQRQHLTSDVPR